MAINTPQKLGPGHLRFGALGSGQEFGSLTTKTTIEPDVKEEEPVALLDGSYYVDPGEILGTLKGTFYQDYGLTGLTAWTWQHAGQVMEFEFKPRSDSAMTISGKCKIKPVTVGGDSLKANTADFEFSLTQSPTLNGTPAPAPSGSE